MNLYHVQYDCGDYYCDSMHTVGIFATLELAEEAIEIFKGKVMRDASHYSTTIRQLDKVED